MKIHFACPTCGKPYEVDASMAGRTGRCKPCGALMTVPNGAEGDYALVDPGPTMAPSPRVQTDREGVYEESPASVAKRRGGKKSLKKKIIRQAKEEASDLAAIVAASWRWLVGVPLGLVVVFGLIAWFVPYGTLIVASILALAGIAMVLTGFIIGAYGAFHEDVLNGMLYVFIPLYTAYFIATNWDAMWRWFTLMAVGSVLILIAGKVALPALERMTKTPDGQSRLILPDGSSGFVASVNWDLHALPTFTRMGS